MRSRSRHPRLVAIACAVYGVMIWLYPAIFRRPFGHEMRLTFRNRVEDVLDRGDVSDWIAFAAHVVWDTIRASATLAIWSPEQRSVSLLGLSEGDAAHGCIQDVSVGVDLMFAVAGLVLGFAGWYAYFAILPSYVH